MESMAFSMNPGNPTHSTQNIGRTGSTINSVMENIIPFVSKIKIGVSQTDLSLLEQKMLANKESETPESRKEFNDQYSGILKNIQSWSIISGDSTNFIEADKKIKLLERGMTDNIPINEILGSELSEKDDEEEDYEDLISIIVSAEDAENSSDNYGDSLSPDYNIESFKPQSYSNILDSTDDFIFKALSKYPKLSKKIQNMSSTKIDNVLQDINKQIDIKGSTVSAIERVKTRLELRAEIDNARPYKDKSGNIANIERRKVLVSLEKAVTRLPFFTPLRKEANEVIEELKRASDKHRSIIKRI